MIGKNRSKVILYITAQAPWGRGESFINEEMLALRDLEEILIVPRSPSQELFHLDAVPLSGVSIRLPLLSREIVAAFIFSLFKAETWKILAQIVRHSRSWRITAKNFIVVPKGVFVANLLKKKGNIEHIHAHWGSTTATMAWVIAELARIPWSMTLHRWDITEDNMLKLKIRKAAFVRCISESGRHETLKIVGEEEEIEEKVKIIHMGVSLPKDSIERRPRDKVVLASIGNLLPVKGHQFLVEACAILVKKNKIDNISCLIIGDGPCKERIRQQISRLELDGIVGLAGRLPHSEIIRMFRNGEIDILVHPSIVTENGEKEGIPVALMEAMAHHVPVISTNTGGIPELLQEGAGIIVPEKDSEQLAKAIFKLISDRKFADSIAANGYRRVKEEFNLTKNVMRLVSLMKTHYKSSVQSVPGERSQA